MSWEKSGESPCLTRLPADLRSLDQLVERDRGVHGSLIVEVSRQEAIDDEPPVERQRAPGGAHQLEDRRRTICGNGIVEPGPLGDFVRLGHIFEQQKARHVGGRIEPVKPHVLARMLVRSRTTSRSSDAM